ncbi:hypothetical protein CC80DRAFT_402278, partial [Byssothecium circinans]
DNNKVYGLISSHPAACLAAAKTFRNSISTMRLNFIRKYVVAVIKASLVSYIKDANLRGSLFNTREIHSIILLVYTNFFINYTKLLKALA